MNVRGLGEEGKKSVTIGLSAQVPPAASPRRHPILLCAALSSLSLLTACSHVATARDTATIKHTNTQVAIQTWSMGGGQDRTSAASRDLARVATTAAAADITGLRTACASLRIHEEAAQAYASIPDRVAQSHWSDTLDQAGLAATDCIAFTQNLDPKLLTWSDHEFASI